MCKHARFLIWGGGGGEEGGFFFYGYDMRRLFSTDVSGRMTFSHINMPDFFFVWGGGIFICDYDIFICDYDR